MHAIFQTIRKFSDTDANLLLLGENGTGKDLIARYVYEQSPRKKEVYVPIDLGSIPETLFESELFGYEKGAFTDARNGKPGRMEVASGGTLFLNEIGNLKLPLQAKLLSVIEQRRSSRIGSTASYPVDVRLICATNSDLYAAIDKGEFRQDLLYRINTIEIRIPPLRERGNDLFLLADFFLQRYKKKYRKDLRGISKEARKQMQLYRWPGNVRELEHAIERAVILSGSTLLTAEDFNLRNRQSQEAVSERERYNIERMEKENINEVLRICGGNITLAAEMLGSPLPDNGLAAMLHNHRLPCPSWLLHQFMHLHPANAGRSLCHLPLYSAFSPGYGTIHMGCTLFRISFFSDTRL